MWWNLDQRIRERATRLVVEHETYAKAVHDENDRRRRRSSGDPKLLPLHRPATWDLDHGFNPYLVRSRHQRIAHALTERLRGRTYTPRRPAGFHVPKPSGGSRVVSTFQIADEVISNRLLRSLTRKNLSRMSARSYAYRPDLSPHDAIAYVSTEFTREHRLFVAEYDFSKFFDTVDHNYLLDALDTIGVTRTPLEQFLIERFLESPEPYLSQKRSYRTQRTATEESRKALRSVFSWPILPHQSWIADLNDLALALFDMRTTHSSGVPTMGASERLPHCSMKHLLASVHLSMQKKASVSVY